MYVLAYIDDEGNVSHYPLGDKGLAEEYKKLLKNAVIVKVKEYEVVDLE